VEQSAGLEDKLIRAHNAHNAKLHTELSVCLYASVLMFFDPEGLLQLRQYQQQRKKGYCITNRLLTQNVDSKAQVQAEAQAQHLLHSGHVLEFGWLFDRWR